MADLAEERLDVLRLDGEDDDVGALDRLGVRGGRLDAVALVELGGALLAPGARDDVCPVGATQPGEERLADLAGAENRDSHPASLRVRRGIPPADTHSRARPTRRRARAARPSPRPRRGRPHSAEASFTSPRSRASPARSGRALRGRRPRPTTARARARARAAARRLRSGAALSASRSSERQSRTSAAPRRAPRPRLRSCGGREAARDRLRSGRRAARRARGVAARTTSRSIARARAAVISWPASARRSACATVAVRSGRSPRSWRIGAAEQRVVARTCAGTPSGRRRARGRSARARAPAR